MNHISPKEKARQGMHLMKEAILDILLEGMDASERIGPQKITERTGNKILSATKKRLADFNQPSLCPSN